MRRHCSQIVCGSCISGEKKFKECLERAFFQTKVGRYLERLNCILMFSSAAVYVVMSYTHNQEGIHESDAFNKLDMAVCILIMFLWLVKFYVSQNRKQYLKKV